MKGSHATVITVAGLLFAGIGWLLGWDRMVIAFGVCAALGGAIGYFATGSIRAELREQEHQEELRQQEVEQAERARQQRRASRQAPAPTPTPEPKPVGEAADPLSRPDVILALMDIEIRKYEGTAFPARWLWTRQILETVPPGNNVWNTLRTIALMKDVQQQAEKIQVFLDTFEKIMKQRSK